MTLTIDHFLKTIATLKEALKAIEKHPQKDDILFDLYRNAAIKSFELSLETAGKLLRKCLKIFEASPRVIDHLVFNDVLRHAHKHGVLEDDSTQRWLNYRLNRNNTAHDDGEGFANDTLKLLPQFIIDCEKLAFKMQEIFNASHE
jgi:nucleotidyltransferase substrate binding protein (TIGR01987 family)